MEEVGAAVVDLSALEYLDPSTADGHRVVYDRELQLEMRLEQSEGVVAESGPLEPLRVKLLVLGEEECPAGVRIECTSENDLFFHYTHTVDEAGFLGIQEQQGLTIDFIDYVPVLIRMLNDCISSPTTTLGLFVLQRGGQAHLDFIQNLEYKFVELLSVSLIESDEDIIRKSITHRYQCVKSRLAIVQTRLTDFTALVKIKNPSLVMQMYRAGSPSNNSAFGRTLSR